MAKSDVQKTVDKVKEGLTKDLPNLVKENKGAALGAVVGYLLADKIEENQGVLSTLVGALIGKTVDDNKKNGEEKF